MASHEPSEHLPQAVRIIQLLLPRLLIPSLLLPPIPTILSLVLPLLCLFVHLPPSHPSPSPSLAPPPLPPPLCASSHVNPLALHLSSPISYNTSSSPPADQCNQPFPLYLLPLPLPLPFLFPLLSLPSLHSLLSLLSSSSPPSLLSLSPLPPPIAFPTSLHHTHPQTQHHPSPPSQPSVELFSSSVSKNPLPHPLLPLPRPHHRPSLLPTPSPHHPPPSPSSHLPLSPPFRSLLPLLPRPPLPPHFPLPLHDQPHRPIHPHLSQPLSLLLCDILIRSPLLPPQHEMNRLRCCCRLLPFLPLPPRTIKLVSQAVPLLECG
ncbi:unnamed protein product [Closterium sp. Yama58-4]|nr:unnamed protein product [Closterium sp. Yama58-4]